MGTVDGSQIVLNSQRPTWRWMHWSFMIIGVAVLTLAVLNPLLCLIHYTFSQRAIFIHHRQFFLCHLTDELQPTALPAHEVWREPRMVYEIIPVMNLVVLPVILLVALITFVFPVALQYSTPPTSPPPKHLTTISCAQ